MWERNIKNKTSTYITPTCIVTCTDELFVMQAEMYIIMLIIALSRSQGSSMIWATSQVVLLATMYYAYRSLKYSNYDNNKLY